MTKVAKVKGGGAKLNGVRIAKSAVASGASMPTKRRSTACSGYAGTVNENTNVGSSRIQYSSGGIFVEVVRLCSSVPRTAGVDTTEQVRTTYRRIAQSVRRRKQPDMPSETFVETQG